MPKRVRARPSQATAPPTLTAAPVHGRCNRKGIASDRASVVELGNVKQVGTCPVCGKSDKLDVTRIGGRWKVGCWVCCPPDATPDDAREYLRDLADAVGCRPFELLSDPLAHLGGQLDQHRPSRAPRVSRELSEAHVAGWASRLRTTPHALAWLHGRGLTDETIRIYELGYDGDADAITIPVRDEHGEFVNVRRRYLAPDSHPKMMGLPGRGSQLYPLRILDDDPAALLVCEGETDALLLNQPGIAAVTSTAGTSWKPEWDRFVAGRSVAVMYDAGARSYERAERRALALEDAGAKEAWPVDLSLVGFADGEDVGDWFVTYGWEASALKAFLNESRRWYRAERRAA